MEMSRKEGRERERERERGGGGAGGGDRTQDKREGGAEEENRTHYVHQPKPQTPNPKQDT